MQYFGQEVPSNFIDLVLTKSLFARNVGRYNTESYQFLSPKFDFFANKQTLNEAYEKTGLPVDEFVNVAQLIFQSVTVEPHVDVYDSLTNENLTQLAHVIVREDQDRQTDLLYLSDNKFFVLYTNRSTIKIGDILVCTTMPIGVGQREEFLLYRDGKRFCPDEMKYGDYVAPFYTDVIKSLSVLSSPSVYNLVDESAEIGDTALAHITDNIEDRFFLLYNDVKNLVGEFTHDSLELNARFPKFDWILNVSKKLGISTYTMCTLIEEVEKRTNYQYAYVEDDWKMSPQQLEAREKEKQAKLKAEQEDAAKEFSNALKSLKQRRVALFFKAAAKVTDKNKEYFNTLIAKLDAYADKGYGTKGWAASEYSTALQNTKPKSGENIRTGIILAVILAVAAFVGITWVTTANSKTEFKRNMAVVMSKLENDMNFNAAVTSCDSLHKAFKPSFMAFTVSGEYTKTLNQIKSQKHNALTKLYDNINTMLEADDGKFTPMTDSMMLMMLDIDENDSRTQEIKAKYIAQ